MNKKQTKEKQTVVRILRYIIPHWTLILASTVAGVIKLTLPLVLPQVMKYFTDDLLVAGNMMSSDDKIKEIMKWMLILFALYLFIYIPATYVRQIGSIEVSNRIMNKMRCELFEHMQLMSAQFHNTNKSGSLVTRVNSDVEMVHGFVWSVATNIWIDMITMIIYIILLVRINVTLTLIACITLPLSVIATRKIRERIRENSTKVLEGHSDIAGYMQERMAGYSVVKLFGMRNYENSKFREYSNDIYQYNKKTNRAFSAGEAITGSFSEIISTLIICLSAVFIVKGKMTIGEMIVFETYLVYFITPIRRFAELSVTYSKCIAGIERVFNILDTEPEIKDKESAIQLTNQMPMNIAFDQVSFRYDKSEGDNILNAISFSVKPGEKVALVGSSGCGKSTIINLMARFYDVDSGAIKIDGKDIRDYQLESLYDQMGIVFQDTILFSGTIRENLLYGKQDASAQELQEAAKASNAEEFIQKCPDGWDTMLGERGIGLSGGQKQRIAIARVFLKNPKLLILDEATSALDSESEHLVQEALDHLMTNRTTIVIAHRLSTIVNSDKIIVMDHGGIVEIGTHEELLRNEGRYKELYTMQFREKKA